ncbi:MAG: ABC transporter permease [Nitrososphaerota archaeon]|jgi:ABC-2 type transport system permease protein|nr:ABC transporter permease [Nitrososphaerota archaeon]
MVGGLIKYHVLSLVREPITMFLGIGLPFAVLLMQANQITEAANPYFIDGFLGVLISMAIMVLCFNDSAYSHAYTRQIKFLRRLRMTPIKPWHYIATGILSRIAILIGFTGVLVGVMHVAFDLSLADRNWPLLLGVTSLAFIMFYLIGMFIANLSTNAKMSQGLAMAAYFFMLTLGGVMFPIQNMPYAMQTVANWIPSAFAITSLQHAWMGFDLLSGHYLVTMIATTAVFGLLSVKFFKYE